jgi:tetratricopeptide (TPR) repeat protein
LNDLCGIWWRKYLKIEFRKIEFKKNIDIDKLNPGARIGILKTEIYKHIHSHFIPVAMEKKISHILAERENDPHAFVLLGHLYMQMKDFPEARDYFKKAIDRENPPSSAYEGMGLLFLRENSMDNAFDMFKKAVEKSPFNEGCLNNLAYLYFLKGDFQTAIEHYEKILNLDHEFILPYCEIALSHRLKGELGKAAGYFTDLEKRLRDQKLINLDKNKGPWLFNAPAEPDLEPIRLFDVNDKRLYALLSLGATLFIRGEKTAAETQMANARAMDTDERAAVIDLVKRDLRRFQEVRPKQGDAVYEFRLKFQRDLSRTMP